MRDFARGAGSLQAYDLAGSSSVTATPLPECCGWRCVHERDVGSTEKRIPMRRVKFTNMSSKA